MHTPKWLRIKNKGIRWIIGTSFIILGIIGLFLPFLQGIAFIALGIIIIKASWLKQEAKNIKKKVKKTIKEKF